MRISRWFSALVIAIVLSNSPQVFASTNQYKTLDKPKPLTAFLLKDQAGNDFGLAQLQGHWSLIFIGFTTCPDICPLTLMQLEAVRADLGLRFTPEHIPNIIFLAVDPKRDQAILGKYLAHFHPDNIGVTGESKQIDIFVRGIDAFYRFDQKPGSDHYDVMHTTAIAVVDPEAQLVARISPPFEVNPIAEYLTHMIRQAKRHE